MIAPLNTGLCENHSSVFPRLKRLLSDDICFRRVRAGCSNHPAIAFEIFKATYADSAKLVFGYGNGPPTATNVVVVVLVVVGVLVVIRFSK